MTIRSYLHLPTHLSTKFIEIDPDKCQGCWTCVDGCPNHVLGKVIIFTHRHAHVDHAEACQGCKKCVRNCPKTAIRYLYVPVRHQPHNDQAISHQIVAVS